MEKSDRLLRGSLHHLKVSQQHSMASFSPLLPHLLSGLGAAFHSWSDAMLSFPQSADILSTIGYDSIIQHLNNGRKNCKEFEEFLKERYDALSSLKRVGQDVSTPTRNNFLFFICVEWF